MKQQSGFTLLEVLVAAVIVIVLTAVGVTSYSAVTQKSRDARRTSDLEQVRSALEMYRSDNGYYPNAGNGNWTNISSLSAGGLVPSFMQSIPADPRDTTNYYQYKATNVSGGNYYGYCLTAKFETLSVATNNCSPTTTLPNSNYNYGLRNP